jgi:peptidyl-prolyl cis-trans isomerase D
VVLAVKDIQPTHPASLAEVRDRVLRDYRHEKAVDLAQVRAQELGKRAKAGENLASVAKALGFEMKTSEPFPRTGSISDLGSAKQLSAAFALPAGQAGDPVFLGANWVVYRVAQHNPVSQDEFAKQKSAIQADALQAKRQTAYELFRTSLETRLQQEGKLHVNQDNLKRLTTPA